MQDQTIPKGRCQCGCGGKTRIAEKTDRAIGHVRGEPLRFINHHGNGKATKYVVNETGCWIWQLQVGPLGYGRIVRDGKILHAHRWMYEQKIGPLADDQVLHHTCRDKRCVNPEHLEPMSAARHMQLHSPADVTDAQVREIREAQGETLVSLAERFNLSVSYIHALRAGATRLEAGGPLMAASGSTRLCEQCGKPFPSKGTLKRFCKPACRSLAWYHANPDPRSA